MSRTLSSDPNGEGRDAWPTYTADQDVVMDFAIGGPTATVVRCPR